MKRTERNPPRTSRRASVNHVEAGTYDASEDTPRRGGGQDFAARWVAKRTGLPIHLASLVAGLAGLGIRP